MQTYRPDIDGLRTIAVGSVLLFHAFPDLFPGGYIGVDIFFVISGYLIGSIILDGFDRGDFSYLQFYARRARRIFPALALVLASSLAIGWFMLLPEELEQLGRHVVGGAAFVANLLYWSEVGYFDNAGITKPLLHLWSLGVEEQFYILFPLIVGACAMLTRRRGLVLMALFAGSFAYSAYAAFADPTAAFYSPLSRFWELLLGCMLVGLKLPERTPTPVGQALSLAGVVLIAIGLAVIVEGSPFPGAYALLPTAGAAMIILAGPGQWLNRTVLSSRPFVGIGLISYPLYLWHWPLISFLTIAAGREPPMEFRLAAVAASFALAWATYRFVERPIRTGLPQRPSVALATGSLVVVGSMGIATLLASGFPGRPAMQPYTVDAQRLNVDTDVWQTCPGHVKKGTLPPTRLGCPGHGHAHRRQPCSVAHRRDRRVLQAAKRQRHHPCPLRLHALLQSGRLAPRLQHLRRRRRLRHRA